MSMTRGKYLRIVDYKIDDTKLRSICRFIKVNKYVTHWWITTTCRFFTDARMFEFNTVSYRHHKQSIRRNFRSQMGHKLSDLYGKLPHQYREQKQTELL